MTHPYARWPIALLLALACAPAGAAVRETLVNGGFEEWTADGPEGWMRNTHVDLSGSWEASDQARTGKRAVLLRPGARGNSHVYQWHFAVSPGKLFRAAAWAKGKGQGGIQLYTYDGRRVFNGSWSGTRVPLDATFRQLCICYAPERAEVGHVALVLVCEGEGAHAIFDDVAIETLDVAALATSSGTAPDLAAEAGKWTATEGGGAEACEGPFRAPGLTCRFAPRVAADRSFDPETWWRQAGGGQSISWREVNGPRFPLRGSIPHEVRFRTSALNGQQVHFKLRYYDADGKEVTWLKNTWAYHQLGGMRTGSWPWREVATTVVPPEGTRTGRFEVWAADGSGPVRVADIAVRPVAVSISKDLQKIAPPSTDVVAADARPVELPRPSQRPAVAFRLPAKATTRVVAASSTALEVELATGVTLRGAFEGENFLGIGEVRLGSLTLHAAKAPPWAPLLRAEPTADYQRCELLGVQPQAAGHREGVTLRLRLVARDGTADEVAWTLWPHRVQLAEHEAIGFGYTFAASSKTRTLQAVIDRTVWGLAGTAAGLTVQTQQTYALKNVFALSEDGGAMGGGGLRFVHADPLDFQTGPEGSLVVYFDRPSFVSKSPAAVRWGVRVHDEFRRPWGKRIASTPKYVVFTPQRGPDAWSAARDVVFDINRKVYDLYKETPRPMVNVSRLQYQVCPESKAELRRIAAEWVPEFQRLGFKRIYLGPLWEGIVCGPDRHAIGERYGGEAALKALCRAAHKAGIQVIAWLAPAHLWHKSSIFKAHPDWELKGADGKPPTTYCWPTLRGVDLTTPYADEFVADVRGLHRRTGLDGLWLDSYCSFTHFIRTADPQFPLRQGEALWGIHRRLHKLGMVTYVEGCACYGIKSNGLPSNMADPERPEFPDPATFYDSSPYCGPWAGQKEQIQAAYIGGGDHYYRYLANKCCPFIYYERILEVPGAIERVARANHDYNAVVRYMQRRILLPDDKGVQWNHRGRPKVLFAFEDFDYAVDGLRSARDVTTGRRLRRLGGTLKAQKGHTYLLTTGRSWWPF